jgi:hypothetical protein
LPDTSHLTDIANRVGNDQLKVIHENKDRLAQEVEDWQKRKDGIGKRGPLWKELLALLTHAADLPVAAEVGAEVKAIEEHRRLLDDPDPVPGLIDKLTQALRSALNQVHARCTALHREGQGTLAASAAWKKLSPQQQQSVVAQYQLDGVPRVAVGTTEEVLATLAGTRLKEWNNLADALPTRFSQALGAAAKLLEPKAQQVKLPGGTIKNEDDLQSWLSTAEEHIREKLKDGPVIL